MRLRGALAATAFSADTRGMTFGRIILWGLALGAAVGAVVGLVLGLVAYPPTAWFAVIEVGVPGAVLGVLVGLVVGWTVAGTRRARSPRRVTRGGAT
jgi:membrane associated rhomboid family serine protease